MHDVDLGQQATPSILRTLISAVSPRSLKNLLAINWLVFFRLVNLSNAFRVIISMVASEIDVCGASTPVHHSKWVASLRVVKRIRQCPHIIILFVFFRFLSFSFERKYVVPFPMGLIQIRNIHISFLLLV
jgi:hypothetical protein